MNDELTDIAVRLRRSVARLNRRLRLSATGSLSAPQVSILAQLDKCESLTLGELAQIEQMRPPSITPLVRGLEAGGQVRCAKDDEDRRTTRVRITPAGARELEADRQRRNEFLEQRLATLGARDRERAADLVSFLETLLEES